MSDGSDFNSADDAQEGNLPTRNQQATLPPKDLTDPFLSATSPINNPPSGEFNGKSIEQQSVMPSSYQVQAQKYYQTETQVGLDDFHAQFENEAGNKFNERDARQKDGEDSNDETTLDNELNKLQLFQYQSAKDAHGCTKIQTLKDYVLGIQSEQKNPRTNFFDLSRDYYTGRYTGDNKRTITVRSFLETTDLQNYVLDLSMEIIQSNQGCMPIIKTFEKNAYNHKKFVKAIKFYNYKGDCTLKKQIIVDEGVLCDEFRTYDTSLLHFENSIIFYKREENWHKLQMYNVVTNELKEIEGYNIEEPIGEGIRYHVMFSTEIDKTKKYAKPIKGTDGFKKSEKLASYLAKHYVFAQRYRITEELHYENKSLIGFKLQKGFQDKSKEQEYAHLPEMEPPKTRAYMDQNPLKYPVQLICHTEDDVTKEVKFIAFDSFFSYHFGLKTKDDNHLTTVAEFFGNNETHLLGNLKQEIQDGHRDGEQLSEQTLHQQEFPFLKHKNAQFTIQKQKVELKYQQQDGKPKVVDQYFYMTDDNQYMLIYPNYQSQEQQTDVIFQIAKAYQYEPNPDIEYNYLDDYLVRKDDHLNVRYTKVSHICINDFRSKNYLKRASHIKEIVNYEQDFTPYDKIILSTDQQSNLIYIYPSQMKIKETGKFHIHIYNYENNIVNTKQATRLPVQIEKMERIQAQSYQEAKLPATLPPPHTTYYVNSKYRNVVSTSRLIKTEQKTRDRINLDALVDWNPEWAGEIQEKLEEDPATKALYYDLDFKVRQNYTDTTVLVEDNGRYMSVRYKLDICKEDLRLQTYSRSKNWFTFFFTLTSIKHNHPRQHFFAVRRSVKDVIDLGENNKEPIIKMEQEVVVFLENDYSSQDEKDNLGAYTRQMKFVDLIELQKEAQPWLVNLGFEKCMDNRSHLECVPMIYQARGNLLSHHIIVFDVNKMEICRHYSLLTNLKMRSKLRINSQGFGSYNLVRTSDVFTQKQQIFLGGNQTINIIKYQVFSQYYLMGIELPESYDDLDDASTLNPANCTIECQEFAVHYNSSGQNRIQLVGIKQMLISENAQEERQDSFKRIFVLPWIDKKQVIKGSQFVLREFSRYYQMQVIRMLDQEINTLFQHSSETIQYGHQKFLTSEDSHSDYILVISSQLRQRVWMEHFFENSESYWIHHRVIKKLLSMQLAKFENFVLNDDFNALMRDEFYQAQEVLQGKSINDLCLGFPREVAIGLKQPFEQYSCIKGSLIQEVGNDLDEQMNSYETMDLCEKNLLIQLDFNFCSSLRIAAELNSNQAVKQLMTKIFELNDVKYQEIFMIEFPRLLQLPRSERMYDFLTRDFAERMQNEEENAKAMRSDDKVVYASALNFEDVINHPDLPQFLSKKKNYHIKYRFKDFHNEQREIVEDLENLGEYDSMKVQSVTKMMVPKKFRGRSSSTVEADNLKALEEIHDTVEAQEVAKTALKKAQQNINVEHSCINFTKVIIGEKIRSIQEYDYRQVNFNDNHLASIFYIEDEEYLSFYDLEAVRKIIDFQFMRTKEFLKFIMFFYLFGFLFPFILSLSMEITFFLNITYNLCLFTQIWFIMFEFLQMKEQKLEYFMDFWNILDSSQFIFFFTLYCIKMKNQFMTDSLFEIIVSALLLFQSFYKMIYFLRIYESFNNTYQISCLIVKNMYCLMILAGMFVLAFTKQYTVMHLGINDPDGKYEDINSNFLKLVFQTYKQTRGDFEAPTLDDTQAMSSEVSKDIMVSLNLLIQFLQEGVFIYLGVLFFSQIIQAYEKFTPVLPTYMYKTMAKFNNECYDIVDMFVPQRNFKVICFAMDKEKDVSFGYPGFTKSIMNKIEENEDKLKLHRGKDCELGEMRFKKLKYTKSTVEGIQYQVRRIEDLLHHPDRCNSCGRM